MIAEEVSAYDADQHMMHQHMMLMHCHQERVDLLDLTRIAQEFIAEVQQRRKLLSLEIFNCNLVRTVRFSC